MKKKSGGVLHIVFTTPALTREKIALIVALIKFVHLDRPTREIRRDEYKSARESIASTELGESNVSGAA